MLKKLMFALLLCAPSFAQDWQDPAYWGLKKGSYIPQDPGCVGRVFEPPYHNKHKQFDFETCVDVSAYGETLEEAIRRYR